MSKINVSLEVSDKLCSDLLTTCVEGGSAYWLACDKIVRDENKNVLYITAPTDVETDDSFEDLKADEFDMQSNEVGLPTMRLGIQRLLEGSVRIGDKANLTWLLEAIQDEDACSWDAETADLVLQAGMFNEIVYG